MTHNVELAMRETLTSEAAALTTLEDPWPRFVRREASHRRNRRIRGAVFAGALGVAVGVQTNVIPLPPGTPSIAIAVPARALADAPTRGSLAGDRAWLAGLRGDIPGISDSDGLWKVADRDSIHFVYAGDIPGHRIAVALVPLRLGIITSWTTMFFDGPPGATPGQMTESGNTDTRSPVVSWASGDDVNGGAALVVGPTGSTVEIGTGFIYSARGTIERGPITTSGTDGVAVAQLPPSPTDPGTFARVTDHGKVIFDADIGSGWSRLGNSTGEEPTDAALIAAVKGAQGPVIDPAVLTTFVRSALQDSRLSAKDVTLRLRWSGSVNGKPAALLTIQPAGGGVLAYAMHGDTTSWRTDLRLLLPAAGANQRPLAWRMRAEGSDAKTDSVIVVAPPGAAAVNLTTGGDAPVRVALDYTGAGTATVPPDQPATVTALDKDGAALASTPVPLLENNSGRLPGDSPQTRIVN